MKEAAIGFGVCILWVVAPLALALLLAGGRADRRESERNQELRQHQKTCQERDLLRVRLLDATFAANWNAHVAQAIALATGVTPPPIAQAVDLTGELADLHAAVTVEDAFPSHGGTSEGGDR